LYLYIGFVPSIAEKPLKQKPSVHIFAVMPAYWQQKEIGKSMSWKKNGIDNFCRTTPQLFAILKNRQPFGRRF
jgi:hypothetical protein